LITAVDTNVLLDIFGADPVFGRRSAEALRSCSREGRLVACEVVWTEAASMFSSPALAQEALERLAVEFSALSQDAALAAATAWKTYRSRGGRRERVVADFLVGAHARIQAERLLTRDRGFYRVYFSGLSVLDPGRGR
jgi:predicted nucleic acid-binding protein